MYLVGYPLDIISVRWFKWIQAILGEKKKKNPKIKTLILSLFCTRSPSLLRWLHVLFNQNCWHFFSMKYMLWVLFLMSTHNICFCGEIRNDSLILHTIWSHVFILTLVMLNKLRCHAWFQFLANQITNDPGCWYNFTYWQTVKIQISWLLKPTDLDLHCLPRQIIFGFNRHHENMPM